MKSSNFKLEAKQVDDWAKLLFDTLSRIGLLSAFGVIAHRERLDWLLWVVVIAGLCLVYWIIFTSILRMREARSEEAWKEASATLGGRIRIALLMCPVLVVISLAALGSVHAIAGLSRVPHTQTVICLPGDSAAVAAKSVEPMNSRR